MFIFFLNPDREHTTRLTEFYGIIHNIRQNPAKIYRISNQSAVTVCTITVRIRSRTISTVIKTKTVTDCGCFGNKLISVITKSSLYVSCLLFPCIWKAPDYCGCLITIHDRHWDIHKNKIIQAFGSNLHFLFFIYHCSMTCISVPPAGFYASDHLFQYLHLNWF